MKVHRGIARVPVRCRRWATVSPPKALEAGRRLDQRSVHREVLVRQKPSPMGICHHLIEQLLAHTVPKQPRTVLGEDGRVEAALHQAHVQEPPEQKVVLQFLPEGPLTADRVQSDKHRGLHQALRSYAGPAYVGVHAVELGRQPCQRLIGQGLDGAKRNGPVGHAPPGPQTPASLPEGPAFLSSGDTSVSWCPPWYLTNVSNMFQTRAFFSSLLVS